MDNDTPATGTPKISYEGPGFRDLAGSLKNRSNGKAHLSLFLGVYRPDKKEALEELARETGGEIATIDLEEVVSRSEEETYRALDRLFDRYAGSDAILYFENGDQLCGVYTNYSHSRVKYASPQERYFMRKAKAYGGVVIVDISEFSAADKTIRRAADSIVIFTLPGSPIKRFLWHLKNYTLHGFQLRSKRPDAYADTAGNF